MKNIHICPQCKSPDAKMEKIDGNKVCISTGNQDIVQFRCDKCGVTAIHLRIYLLVED